MSTQPSFFQGLGPDELAWVHAVLERRSVPDGAIFCAEGDQPGEMYVLAAGEAEVFLIDRHGVEQVIACVGPGATVGEMALFTGQPASASARACGPLELLVISQTDFAPIAAALPRLYHNLGAILAQRLARSNRAAAAEPRGRLVFLRDLGAPPLLGYALACSVAWHTRRATLLVLLTPEPSAALLTLAGDAAHGEILRGTAVPTRRASLLVAAPDDGFAPAELPATLARLAERYDQVLVQSSVGLSLPAGTRMVRLDPAEGAVAPDGDASPLTIRAWSSDGGQEPARREPLRVPRLEVADEVALGRGLLPTTTPAGRALGRAARDLAGLRVGLALGAGSVKGYAHFGVLRALERMKLAVDTVSGTSIGAIVATMHALGYGADEAARVMAATSGRAFRLGVPTSALLSNAGVRRNFAEIGGDTRFEDLAMPLGVVAADIVTGREVVLRRGLLRTAVLASMAIPGIYPPVLVGDMALVDGGVLNPVPGDVAAHLGADVVIAVSLSSRDIAPTPDVQAIEGRGSPPGLLQVIGRSIELMQSRIERSTASRASVLIEPRFAGMATLGLRSFAQGGRYIELGEAAAEQALPRLEAALPWLRS
jgi:NTE family protein